MNPDRLSMVVRALAFVSLFQAAGAAFFLALFGSRLGRSEQGIRRLGWYSALAGLLLLAAHRGLEGARMADDYAGLLDPALQRLAWSGSGGNAAVLQIIALSLVALGLARRSLPAASVAGIGALIAVCAFALTGHTSEHSPRALLAALLCVHLLLVAFWFGALLPLRLCIRRETLRDAAATLQRFSAVAGALVPWIGVAGLTMALILIRAPAGWRAVYGLLLLGKLGAFMLLLLLAGWNRWRAVPAMAVEDASLPSRALQASTALRRSIAIEYVLMVTVLSMTALLTSFYSP
ncbi:MAG: copper resistance D family protein [Steroidobacterales bacterium]